MPINIKDPRIAEFAAKKGAHLIGMILTPGFRRSVTLSRAKKIAEAARKFGAVPVGVFVRQSSEEIVNVCHYLNLQLVQAYELSSVLPNYLKRIFINEYEAQLRHGHDFRIVG